MVMTTSEFKTIKEKAKTTLLTRQETIVAARLAANNLIPDELRLKIQKNFRSSYMPSDFSAAISATSEYLTMNQPTFLFSATKKNSTKIKRDINKLIRNIINVNNLNYKISKLIEQSLIDGFVVFELVYKPAKPSFYVYTGQLDAENNESIKLVDLPESGSIDLVIYDALRTYIDPNANPKDITNTAEYIIVNRYENLSLNELKKIGERENWQIEDYSELQAKSRYTEDNYNSMKIKIREGFDPSDIKGYCVDTIYYNNGTVETFVNEEYLVNTGLNNKMINSMPLIVFTPFSSYTPYGITMYELTKTGREAKMTIINLIADNAIRNLTSPTFTSDSNVVDKITAGEIEDGQYIHIEAGIDGDVTKLFYKPMFADFTNGLNTVLNTIQNDIDKTSKISTINQGIQQKQIRTNAVLEAMNSSTDRGVLTIINNVELNVFKPLAQHILSILATYFHKFDFEEGVDQDTIINAYKTIRIKNGSSLSEDKISRLQALNMLLEDAQSSPSVFKLIDILKEKYDAMGLDDIDMFIEDANTTIEKTKLEYGAPVQMLKSATGMR